MRYVLMIQRKGQWSILAQGEERIPLVKRMNARPDDKLYLIDTWLS